MHSALVPHAFEISPRPVHHVTLIIEATSEEKEALIIEFLPGEVPCEIATGAIRQCFHSQIILQAQGGDDQGQITWKQLPYSDESDDLLIIPQSDNYLNIAYMLYDSIALTIPLKHVHPAGKCNKGMAEQLKKHSAHSGDESDFDIDNEFSDDNDADFDDKNDNNESDPRWDALKKLTDNN